MSVSVSQSVGKVQNKPTRFSFFYYMARLWLRAKKSKSFKKMCSPSSSHWYVLAMIKRGVDYSNSHFCTYDLRFSHLVSEEHPRKHESLRQCWFSFLKKNAEFFFYKLWKPRGFIEFEIILNVSISSF